MRLKMPKLMQAAVITHYKQTSPEIKTVPIPTLQPTDVLVKIKAASLNPIDLKTMAGGLRPLLTYDMPLIIGSDFSGEIVAIGSRVTQFQVGDAVYGRPQKTRIGSFAEYLAIDAQEIALKPSNLSYEESAAVPLVGLTSYQALHDILKLHPGQKILIQAGAGGIGTLAIQLAKRLGATVATTTSAANVDFVRSLGADQIIDYHTQNFADLLTNYDAVFDTLGGHALEQAFSIVKPSGQIVSISGLPDRQFAQEYGLPRWKQALFGVVTHRLTRLQKQTDTTYHFLFMWPSGAELATLARLIEAQELRPIIDRTFPFHELDQALTTLKTGHARGKIVLSLT